MDLSRLLTGLLNRLFRQALNKGIKTGINHMAAKGKDPAQMSPSKGAQTQKANELAKRARQMAKLTRRIGR